MPHVAADVAAATCTFADVAGIAVLIHRHSGGDHDCAVIVDTYLVILRSTLLHSAAAAAAATTAAGRSRGKRYHRHVANVELSAGAPTTSTKASANGVVAADHDDLGKSGKGAAASASSVLPIAVASDRSSSSADMEKNGAGTVAAKLKRVTLPSLSPSTMVEEEWVAEELRANGQMGTRKTKLICTIGPATCSAEQLEALALGGMNVARLNMCHGTHDWHRQVIQTIRTLNKEKGLAVAVMIDTEGSEVHMGDLKESPVKASDNDVWTFSVRQFVGPLPPNTLMVNYDGFVDDIMVGDEIVVDGGMSRFEVIQKNGPDVIGRCTDPGLLLPRANLTFWRNGQLLRERNSMLPTITSKDWIDIDFGIAEEVDFISVSFVKSADVIVNLKRYIETKSPKRPVAVVAKIESVECLSQLEDIIGASDGAMVARGDLGAQIALERVPAVQQQVVQLCRQLNKPVIVASQLLESMIEYPTPTRAEVADVGEAVRQNADALMLSGESAMGKYPMKALEVLASVSTRIENYRHEDDDDDLVHLTRLSSEPSDRISEEVCIGATQIANNLDVEALFVYTRSGQMASLLSRCRPNCPIFVFTDSQVVRQRLSLYWGLIPFRLRLSEDMETNVTRTFALLRKRGFMKPGDMVVMVSDLCAPGQREILQSVQIRKVS
ncbi:hypothetical protein CBR_g38625 [Chara braunii]|uniref:Pyruvate kinase n=1 Tax=Chara braunii TaxID=69332 RepID=A0A388K0J1_CHABU|nr:hypothetical protein CBR_g38625 [Chara braunii]|eukprot:GBG63558.1 hypothetical protein CBR_g38625 [Chara braunii]